MELAMQFTQKFQAFIFLSFKKKENKNNRMTLNLLIAEVEICYSLISIRQNYNFDMLATI